MDLNIVIQRDDSVVEKDKVIRMIKQAYKLGYEAVALNVVIGEDVLNQKNKMPHPPVFHTAECGPEIQTQKTRFKILTRLTAIANESIQCHRLFQSAVAKDYDLIAVVPRNEKIFHYLCNQGEFDIISLPFDGRMSYVTRRQQLGLAASRGLSIEIQYAPCIRDQTARQQTIGNCFNFMQVSRGKGIFISSGAEQVHHLRSPADVTNLAFLFNMNESAARDAVYGNCKCVILHSETRRRENRAVIFSKNVTELPKGDTWLVESCKLPQVEESSAKRAPEVTPDARQPPKKKRKKGSKGAATVST